MAGDSYSFERIDEGGPAADGRAFLPTTRDEMNARGWDDLDILIVTGDAYVDHPAFGPVLIARFLEGRGYRVGIVAQPSWKDTSDILRMVGLGSSWASARATSTRCSTDSRAEEDAARRISIHQADAPGMRPNRATIVYANLCRQAFPGLPVVLGASRRRSGASRTTTTGRIRSPFDSPRREGRPLVFGMGERAAWEIAQRLAAGETVRTLRDIRGTAFPMHHRGEVGAPSRGPDALRARRQAAAAAVLRRGAHRQARLFFDVQALPVRDQRPQRASSPARRMATKPCTSIRPALPLEEAEMDALYDLPFERRPHPSYRETVPAFETVKHSIVTMRGCFGGCTFCSITEHEGRIIQSRSSDNVLPQVRALSRMGDFRGVISDLGGPTANMYKMAVQGRDDRERMPPAVVRPPRDLREPGHRSRSAPRSDEEGADRSRDQEGVHRLGRSLRPRGAKPEFITELARPSYRRPGVGRPRAHRSRRCSPR